MTRLILASASPRRHQLLTQLGLQAQIMAADIDETVKTGETDRADVERMAREKAAAIASIQPDAIVLSADTAISLDGRLIGKPCDESDAMRIWQALSGRGHQVLTAAAVCYSGYCDVAISCSEVYFCDLSRQPLSRYWACGEPRDKAGAYAIQGFAAQWIERISGSYSGIMGLPLYETANLLTKAGIEIVP